jgi:hypothetical protein
MVGPGLRPGLSPVAEVAALRHRVILSPEAEVAGDSVDGALEALMRTIEVPRL